jgi:hypothetical protein
LHEGRRPVRRSFSEGGTASLKTAAAAYGSLLSQGRRNDFGCHFNNTARYAALLSSTSSAYLSSSLRALAKQSMPRTSLHLDCFVASLLAMTTVNIVARMERSEIRGVPALRKLLMPYI